MPADTTSIPAERDDGMAARPEAALADDAGEAKRRRDLAGTYERKDQWQEALEQWQWLHRRYPQQAAPALRLARACLRLGRDDEAAAGFEAALAAGGDEAKCRLNLARVYLRTKQWEKARDQWQWLHEREPQKADHALQLARTCVQLGRDDEAAAGFEAAFAAGADEADCRRNLAAIYERTERWENALQQWQWLHRHEPRQARSALHVARACLRLGRDDEAATAFEAALTAGADETACRRNLARIYERAEQWEKALRQWQSLRAHEPQQAAHALQLARVYLQLGRDDEAAAAFDAGLAAGADEADYRRDLARVYERREQWENALEQWRWLHEHEPQQMQPALRFARACLRLGRDDEAAAGFEAAIASGGDEAYCRRNLARIYERSQQWEKVLENWARLRECDPEAAAASAPHMRLSAEAERLRERVQQLTQANAQLRSAAEQSRLEAQYFRENRPINLYLRFARYCHDRADECRAEAYVAHGVEAMPAADMVAAVAGGRVYCDVVEIPSFTQRSVPYNWHPSNLSLLDNAFEGYLRDAAGLSTIGWALKEELRPYGRPVTVIPNYRYAEELQASAEIREWCGLGPGDSLLLAPSTICGGFEPIIEALRLLPDEVHLATLGILADPDLIRAMPVRWGVAERVHFLDAVPYEQLTTAASGADIGLMAIDPSVLNDRISLPNRLFDCIAAGLPVVTPDAATDMAKIVEERRLGTTVPKNEARYWAAAITAALADRDRLRTNALAAARALVWESLSDRLHAAYGEAASITFISYRDLTHHQRTLRMVDSLTRRGVRVTVCCPHVEPAADDVIPGARLVATPSPLPTRD